MERLTTCLIKQIATIIYLTIYTMLFTPIHKGKRIKLKINSQEIPRGEKRQFAVIGWYSNKIYICRTASCGFPHCMCDAVLLSEKIDKRDSQHK